MRETADVVVIGAGIQGLSVAYHLNKAGIENVVVVEMETIGAGSSGRSAAMLTHQRGSAPNLLISRVAYQAYMVFEEELGIDPGYKPIGLLTVAGPAMADHERALGQMRQSMGARTEILTPEEVKRMVPVVNVEDIAIGLFGVDDGEIDPHLIMQGYATNARRMGTEINEGVRATGLRRSGGRLTGVETTHGLIAAEWAVNAAGAQAAEVGRWARVEIPIDNRRRNVYVTQPFPQIPAGTPMVIDDDVEWYYRKEGPGVLLGMGKEKDTAVSWSINRDFLPQVIDHAIHRVPVLAEAQIMSGWSGIRPLTPDELPIIGPVDGLAGFVNCCGWGGEGVTGAPVGGMLVAEFIATGKAETLDLAPFLLSRFD